MEETTQEIEETPQSQENKGIRYDKIVDVIGTKEAVYINELAVDILGITDIDNVTPIILEKEEENKDNLKDKLKEISELTVNFVENGVELSEPMKKGWIEFLFDGGIVEKIEEK